MSRPQLTVDCRMCRCLLSAASLARPFSSRAAAPSPQPSRSRPGLHPSGLLCPLSGASPSADGSHPRARIALHADHPTLPSPTPRSRHHPALAPRCSPPLSRWPSTALPQHCPALHHPHPPVRPSHRCATVTLILLRAALLPSHGLAAFSSELPPLGPCGIKLPTTPHWCSAL